MVLLFKVKHIFSTMSTSLPDTVQSKNKLGDV